MIINDYFLTKHAKERMNERNISEEEIKEALRNPDYSLRQPRGEMWIEKTIIKGRRIRVVYKTERKQNIILTAMVI